MATLNKLFFIATLVALTFSTSCTKDDVYTEESASQNKALEVATELSAKIQESEEPLTIIQLPEEVIYRGETINVKSPEVQNALQTGIAIYDLPDEYEAGETVYPTTYVFDTQEEKLEFEIEARSNTTSKRATMEFYDGIFRNPLFTIRDIRVDRRRGGGFAFLGFDSATNNKVSSFKLTTETKNWMHDDVRRVNWECLILDTVTPTFTARAQEVGLEGLTDDDLLDLLNSVNWYLWGNAANKYPKAKLNRHIDLKHQDEILVFNPNKRSQKGLINNKMSSIVFFLNMDRS